MWITETKKHGPSLRAGKTKLTQTYLKPAFYLNATRGRQLWLQKDFQSNLTA